MMTSEEEAAHPDISPQASEPAVYPAGSYSSMSQQGWWVFLKHVFSSLAFHMVFAILLAFILVFVSPVANFFTSIPGCLVIYICSIFLPITVVTQQYLFDQFHHLHFLNLFNRPANLFSIGLFTAAVTFSFGLICSHSNGFQFLHVKCDFGWDAIVEFVIIVLVTVLSFTRYKLWGKLKARQFKFMEGQFLLAAAFTVAFSLIQIMFPLGKILIILCGVIVGYIIIIRSQEEDQQCPL